MPSNYLEPAFLRKHINSRLQRQGTGSHFLFDDVDCGLIVRLIVHVLRRKQRYKKK